MFLFPGQRHPAGGLPGQPCALAGLLLCVQPLPVLRLLPGGPARHPPLPAAAAAHPPAGPTQRLSRRRLAGGRPSVPEDSWYLMNRTPSPRKTLQEKPFLPQGFSSSFSVSFVFPFPFCSLKQNQTPLLFLEVFFWLGGGGLGVGNERTLQVSLPSQEDSVSFPSRSAEVGI